MSVALHRREMRDPIYGRAAQRKERIFREELNALIRKIDSNIRSGKDPGEGHVWAKFGGACARRQRSVKPSLPTPAPDYYGPKAGRQRLRQMGPRCPRPRILPRHTTESRADLSQAPLYKLVEINKLKKALAKAPRREWLSGMGEQVLSTKRSNRAQRFRTLIKEPGPKEDPREDNLQYTSFGPQPSSMDNTHGTHGLPFRRAPLKVGEYGDKDDCTSDLSSYNVRLADKMVYRRPPGGKMNKVRGSGASLLTQNIGAHAYGEMPSGFGHQVLGCFPSNPSQRIDHPYPRFDPLVYAPYTNEEERADYRFHLAHDSAVYMAKAILENKQKEQKKLYGL